MSNLEDPFGFERVPLSSDYVLERFAQEGSNDGDLYYIVDTRREDCLEGVFEGIIQKIYVQDLYLYVLVQKCYRGDVDGLYKLDFQTGKVTGPLLEEDIKIKLIDISVFFDNHRTLFFGIFRMPKL